MERSDGTTLTRRLAGILIADVVGYTRLMEQDDAGTFARVRTLRSEVTDPAIVSHGGRIVKTAGDGFLAEFPSVLSALRASIHIQREMAARNTGAAAEERLDYRIGVNLGDIIVDGDDIAGDGVNVASRLEAMAEPGGVCVSGAVREQVHGQLGVEFVDIGEQYVKNIARPIRVFRVGPLDGTVRRAASVSVQRPRPWRVRPTWAAAIAGLAVVALGLWLVLGTGVLSPGEPLPSPLSVAVMPFLSESSETGSRRTATAVARDLAAAIAQDAWLQVAAPSNDAAYRDPPIDPRLAAQRLRVRYLVEGEVTPTALAVRLTEAQSGKHVWSERFAWPKTAREDEIVRVDVRPALHLWRALLDAARDAAVRKAKAQSPIDHVLRGEVAVRLPGSGATSEARRHFEEALQLDPRFVPALVGKSFSLQNEFYFDTRRKHAVAVEMDRLTGLAVQLDPRDGYGWNMRSFALALSSRWEEALAANERARALVPWDTFYVTSAAILRWLAGRTEEAEALQLRAIEMDPPGRALEFRHLCIVRMLLGRYAEAVESCERSGGLDEWYEDQLWLVAAYAQKGDMAKAARARAVLDKQMPGVTVENSLVRHLSDHSVYLRQLEAHVYPGLRKAGIPDR